MSLFYKNLIYFLTKFYILEISFYLMGNFNEFIKHSFKYGKNFFFVIKILIIYFYNYLFKEFLVIINYSCNYYSI